MQSPITRSTASNGFRTKSVAPASSAARLISSVPFGARARTAFSIASAGTEWVLQWHADGTLRVDAPAALQGARFVRGAGDTCTTR